VKTLTLCLLFVATLGFGQRYYAPAPSYQWRTVAADVSFPLHDYADARASGPLHYRQVHLRVSAAKPVSYAIIPSNWLTAFKQEPRRLAKAVNRSGEYCEAFDVVATHDTRCTLPLRREGYYFVIYDDRGPCVKCLVHGAFALAGDVSGLVGLAADLVSPDDNRVIVGMEVRR